MEPSPVGNKKGTTRSSRAPSRIQSLDHDILCIIFSFLDFFDLARCSVVCKTWSGIINKSKLLKSLYYKKWQMSLALVGAQTRSSGCPDKSLNGYLEEMALQHHILALQQGRVHVDHWRAHSVGVDQCRKKMGLLLTGIGDKVMRLWSLESYKCVVEYPILDKVPLVDFDFDESKVVGYAYGGGMGYEVYSPRVKAPFQRAYACGIRTLCYNPSSHRLFVGSNAGYVFCWDLRTPRKMLWETRVSPNVVYSTQHLRNDASSLVVGGIDGVLRILNQNTGEVVSRFVLDGNLLSSSSSHQYVVGSSTVQRMTGQRLPENASIDSIPRSSRPPITCLAVGMKKVITTHNNKYIRTWKFN